MEHIAEQSRFTLDYGQVTPEVWNQASRLSWPDMFSYAPEPTSLVPVFHAIAQQRTSGPQMRRRRTPWPLGRAHPIRRLRLRRPTNHRRREHREAPGPAAARTRRTGAAGPGRGSEDVMSNLVGYARVSPHPEAQEAKLRGADVSRVFVDRSESSCAKDPPQ